VRWQTAAEMLSGGGISKDVPVVISRHAREQWWYNVENVGAGGYPETVYEAAGELREQVDNASAEGLANSDELWDPDLEASRCFSFTAW
jgi:hypothetical protein